jgi:uncharacterized protein (TIGR02611 family)
MADGAARSQTGDVTPPRENPVSARLREQRARHLRRGAVYRIAVAVAGFLVLAAGVAMLVLPGPGLIVCGVGLGLLALEFRWAERLLLRVADKSAAVLDRLRRKG